MSDRTVSESQIVAAVRRAGAVAILRLREHTQAVRIGRLLLDAGARLIKLFPAGPLGPGYLRAMLGPFRDVLFVPTGGIRHEEVATWLRAGAAAVGLGSDLVPAVPTETELEAIAERARRVSKQVTEARAG
jgi:2-keto-3-deoxy-6-phosphogluconate aldolase